MIRTLLLIALFCCARALQAQEAAVITEENTKFNAPGDNPSWRFADGASLEIPSRGANRTWDYSLAADGQGGYQVVFVEPDNPAFPSATVAYNAYYALNQFQLTGRAFFEARSTGEYYVGNAYDAETFNLGFGTLEIPAQTNHLAEGSTDLKLPATMGSTWTTENKLPINTLLTVSTAGLENAPLTYVQTRTHHDSIVGWGTVTLPSGQSYNALLKKQTWVQVDSFYLYGQPAPDQLLTLFGVEQGSTSSRDIYAFFTPGASTEIMLFIVHPNGVEVSYRDDLSISNVADRDASSLSTNLFPNPVAGDGATLAFEKTSAGAWSVAISNALGETVRTVPVNEAAGPVSMRLDLSSSMPGGSYFYEIRDENGKRIAGGSIAVTR